MKFLAAVYRHPLIVASVYSFIIASFTLAAALTMPAREVCQGVSDAHLFCGTRDAFIFTGPVASAFALASIALTLFLSTAVRFAGYSLLWRKFSWATVPAGAFTLVLEVFYFIFVFGMYVQAFNSTALGGIAVLVISLINICVGAAWAVITGALYVASREVPDQR